MNALPAPRFSLQSTLESGQYFRWTRRGDGFEIHLREGVLFARQIGDVLEYEGVDAAIVRRFFALDHDLPAIHAELERDPHLRGALRRFPGLRILRQDPWECMAAFITSAASNIPRITRNVVDMATRFGTPPAFPRPEQMGSERELRDLKLGFRARYLAEAARLARGGALDRLDGSLESVRQALMEYPGIGMKVAECIALFAYGRLDAFPIDTWVRKAMRRLYFRNRRVSDGRIREYAARRFGRWAGYAQQVLFTAERAAKSAEASSPMLRSSRLGLELQASKQEASSSGATELLA